MTIRIFIGYDAREPVAFHALAHSIIKRASVPTSITPICLSSLSRIFQRERDPRQSTDFAYSRFLVPYLSGYEGWSIFVDCDFVFRADVAELWSLRDERFAVMCVKHSYEPTTTTKFLGQVQEPYPKKNWSSLMLLNNSRCKALTPEFVAKATGAELHRFMWLAGDDLIGEIPKEWNFLVGEYKRGSLEPKALHYTIGGPYFKDFRNCDYAETWFEHFNELTIPLTSEPT